MAGTVRPQPNHYETLGVSPTAAGDEITRAFAREGSVYRAHAFGGLAEVCIAYETLRDPIRRRAYDASLGLRREPSLSIPMAAAKAPIARGVMMQPLVARPVPDPAQPRVSKPEPALRLGPAIDSHVIPEPRIAPGSSPRLSLEQELGVEAHPINWRRTGFALGGVVLAACALGGLAGWWSSGAIGETTQSGNVVSLPLPPAKPIAPPETPPIAATPVERVPEVRDEPSRPNVEVVAPRQELLVTPEPPIAEGPIEDSQPEPGLAAEIVAEAPTTPTVTASMPLPDRVIARTIDRIGFSCGSVASTSPVEGEAAGVFKITCSSGQSYRASPVSGRYHFRRWGKR